MTDADLVFDLFQRLRTEPAPSRRRMLDELKLEEAIREEVESLLGSVDTQPSCWLENRDELPKQIGKYPIIRRLGAGGMGEVYLAKHPDLEIEVAVKTILKKLDSDADLIARFRRERQLIAKVDCPHVVRVLDAGNDDNVYYLAMEYIDGVSLSEVVNRYGPLNSREVCEVARQVGVGLAAIGDNGLIHRDIKPSNLILGTDGRIRILDLGLAKAISPRQEAASLVTGSGTILGTVDYMSPEQIEANKQIDIRSELYSLGATIYFLLVGRSPHSNEESPARRLVATLTKAFPNWPPEIEDDVRRVFGRLVENPPEKRFRNPAEFLQALPPSTAKLSHLVTRRSVQSLGIDNRGSALVSTAKHSLETGKITGPIPNNRMPMRMMVALVLCICAVLVAVLVTMRDSKSDASTTATMDATDDAFARKRVVGLMIIDAGGRFETTNDTWHSSDDHWSNRTPMRNFDFSYIDLDDSDIGDGLLMKIIRLRPTKLTGLSLQGTAVSDKGISELANIASLTYLNLRGTEVGDEGVKSLAQLPRLDTLTLDGTKTTTRGVEALRDCVLSDLNLKTVSLAPPAIDALCTLEKLVAVDLRDSGVSAESVQRLLSQIPRVTINVSNDGRISPDQLQNLQATWGERRIQMDN